MQLPEERERERRMQKENYSKRVKTEEKFIHTVE